MINEEKTNAFCIMDLILKNINNIVKHHLLFGGVKKDKNKSDQNNNKEEKNIHKIVAKTRLSLVNHTDNYNNKLNNDIIEDEKENIFFKNNEDKKDCIEKNNIYNNITIIEKNKDN